MYNPGYVKSVKFSVSGTEHNKRTSYIRISKKDQFKNDYPVENGVYDSHMGTINPRYSCSTCKNRSGPGENSCPGHSGSIELRYPVFQKIFSSDCKKVLKVICFSCGQLLTKSSKKYLSIPKEQRLNRIIKEVRGARKNIKCPHCKYVNPHIAKDSEKKNPYSDIFFTVKYYDEKQKKVENTGIVYPHILKEILERITENTLEVLGREVHPSNYVLDVIKVPSVTIRPNEKSMGDKKTSGGLTPMIIHIYQNNVGLPVGLPPKIGIEIDRKYADQIYMLNKSYNDFINSPSVVDAASYGITGQYNETLIEALKGKYGISRKFLLGKRTFKVTRAVITGSPNIPIDEVGIPQQFAKNIQISIRVQNYNYDECMTYYLNGLEKYPGCTGIIKKSDNKFRSIDALVKPILEIGDTILRDLIDGDEIDMNRQPTLTRSSIALHKMRILKETPSRRQPINTQQINVMACPFYNADFDGDQMNGWIVISPMTRNEAYMVAGVQRRFISEKTASPVNGQAQDGVIASALMTRSDVIINRRHAMKMFSNTGITPILDKDQYTGRELISMLLKPINYSGRAKYYNESYAPFVDYNADEIKVEIRKGQLISGVLDKSSIGEGANGGIFHIIALEYGVEIALKIIYQYQQMVLNFISNKGFSLNFGDLIVDKVGREQIKKIESKVKLESKEFTDKLDRGEVIPPIGQTTRQFYENQQISILNTMDVYIEPILKNMDTRDNNLFSMIQYGAKGKPVNLYNISASIGQITINGERLRENLSFGRTSAFSPRFETKPLSRGFISNSYVQGQNLLEVFANSKNSRYDIVTKQLSTSVTGGENRKGVKSNESLIIDNRRFTYNPYGKIVQFAYAGNAIDPTQVEIVKFPTVLLNNNELKEKYFHKDYPDYFEQIKLDRNLYRKIYLNISLVDSVLSFKNKQYSPVNIKRIIDTIIYNWETDILKGKKRKDATKAELKEMIDYSDNFINELYKLYLNSDYSGYVSEHVNYTFTIFKILYRSYINPRTLETMNIKLLKNIIERIKIKYLNSFIPYGESVGILAAQCISEPLTQYMLDSHHRSVEGGTKKDGLNKFKGILGVKSADKIVNPSMHIHLNDDIKFNKFAVQEVANRIETINLSILSKEWMIFYEESGIENPMYPEYAEVDKKLIEDFKKYSIITMPKNLTKWCIMFILNKTKLIFKNISMEEIISGLQKKYPKLYFIYTPENTKNELKIRIYFPTTIFKDKNIQEDKIRKLGNDLLYTSIRGLKGIQSVQIKPYNYPVVEKDGSVKLDKKGFMIESNGINMNDLVYLKSIDKDKSFCDNIFTTYKLYGIEAARNLIIINLRSILKDNVYPSHFALYADNMTCLGYPTSIENLGIKLRERYNTLLRTGTSHALQVLVESAANEYNNKIYGITAPLMIGAIPKVGTLYNQVYVNHKFIKENTENANSVIDDL